MKIHIVFYIPAFALSYLFFHIFAGSHIHNVLSTIFGQSSKNESPLQKPFVNDLKVVKITSDSGKTRLKISERSTDVSIDVDACDEIKLSKEIIYKCVDGSKIYDIVWSSERPNIITMNMSDNGRSMISQTLKYW
ncbi:hypothetical protein [Chamaesiphon sp. VAR_48_metabat_403]|uniref:hypothetical protein n=1 Tax=Chamaesiphon sp. VAR_48_metabat_403 TaxID=2964700 RepID=UPI00286E7EDF|nr:hypothetical protein [Chamaesiphon sp. VAR_48_metabat_403]